LKKLTLISVLCILMLMLTVTAVADFENLPIYDEAGYLTEEQYDELCEKIEVIRYEYSFDVAVVTEAEMSGNSAMETADDIYDYNGFGAGTDDDGIMLYISAEPREYWISTHGYGLTVFNDEGIAYLESEIQPLLAADDYYGAIDEFADLVDELLLMAENGEPYGSDGGSPAVIIILALVIPLAVAFIMMFIKLSKMKTAVANDYAANYIKPGSKRLDVSRDMFLYSHITKTERPKNNGTSTHTSSSGRTHGGGGGSF